MAKYTVTRDCYFNGRYYKKGERVEADFEGKNANPPAWFDPIVKVAPQTPQTPQADKGKRETPPPPKSEA
jgi:hypothetical protein